MTAACDDCWLAEQARATYQVWPGMTANCPGCMDRALAGIKTLPPIEPAEDEPAKQLLENQ